MRLDLGPGVGRVIVFGHFQFGLDRTEAGFHEGVVGALVGAAHALPHRGATQHGAIGALAFEDDEGSSVQPVGTLADLLAEAPAGGRHPVGTSFTSARAGPTDSNVKHCSSTS